MGITVLSLFRQRLDGRGDQALFQGVAEGMEAITKSLQLKLEQPTVYTARVAAGIYQEA